MSPMTATVTAPMIRREIGDDGICMLTFDRPDSGANIFDVPTIQNLSEHLDAIEKDPSLRGVIVTSAKKSIFIAGADLKTLLKQAQTGELRAFITEGQKVFNRLAALKVPTVAGILALAPAVATRSRLPAIIASRPTIQRRRSACPKRRSVSFRPGAGPRVSRSYRRGCRSRGHSQGKDLWRGGGLEARTDRRSDRARAAARGSAQEIGRGQAKGFRTQKRDDRCGPESRRKCGARPCLRNHSAQRRFLDRRTLVRRSASDQRAGSDHETKTGSQFFCGKYQGSAKFTTERIKHARLSGGVMCSGAQARSRRFGSWGPRFRGITTASLP